MHGTENNSDEYNSLLDKKSVSSKNVPNNEESTNLLFRGLQLYLYENDNSSNEFSIESHVNGNVNNIGLNDISIVPSTQSNAPINAPVESLSLSKAKLVKELPQQSGYMNNTLNRQYLPLSAELDPIFYQSLTNAQEKPVDKMNDLINADHQTNKRHKAHDKSNDILSHVDFINKLQKDASDAREKFDIDIRFNVENEEAAPSTQRHVIDQEDSASLHKYSHQYSAQAVHYATIDNLPRPDLGLTHPPLRTDYPTELQNNFIPKARIAFQPTASQYTPQLPSSSLPGPLSVPLPITLPSVVHSVSNYAVPISTSSTTTQAQPQPQSYNYATSAAPAASTHNNILVQSPSKSDSQEKVVVKIVPATGWYLNDAAERRSYYDAVSRGLLRENGYVFVNDVQRQQLQPGKHNIMRRSAQSQSHPSERSFVDDGDTIYHGQTSYTVPIGSVTRLVGDSNSVRSASALAYNTQRTRRRSDDNRNKSLSQEQ